MSGSEDAGGRSAPTVAPALLPAPTGLRLATYNIHKFIGLDGRRDPARTFSVINELGADVVAVQEFDSRKHRGSAAVTVADLESETGMTALVHATRESKRGGYRGNVILTRFPAGDVQRHSIGEVEPRGVMVADLDVGGITVRVAVTHLALWPAARLRQAARLASELSPPRNGMLVLAGDLNEWRRGGKIREVLAKCYGAHPSPPTFPAAMPIVGLDQVWVTPRSSLTALEVHASDLAREASDHLPVKVVLTLPRPDELIQSSLDWAASTAPV